MMQEKEKGSYRRRNLWMIALASVFLVAGILWFLYWVFFARFYVYTDDSYVHGNQVALTTQVSAAVRSIWAEETDLVEEGQLVVELDRSNFEMAYQQRKDELAETVRKVAALFYDVRVQQMNVVVKSFELHQAKLDLQHRKGLADTGAISVEEYEQYQTNVDVAQGRLDLAIKQYEAAIVLVEGTTIATHPLVKNAATAVRLGYLDLVRCQVYAPARGYVAKRSAQVGDQVAKGDTLLVIVPLDDLWLESNYKETRLRHVRIDQPVEFYADIYGRSVKFHGTVQGFQAGTGSAFSLLPPENASGNWIKIIQRVPVRIKLDPKEIEKHPLLIGLSTRVYVNIRDRSGKMLAPYPTEKPIYTTDLFEKQMRKVDVIEPLIERIIAENSYQVEM